MITASVMKVGNFWQEGICHIIITTFTKSSCHYYWGFGCCCYHCLSWWVTCYISSKVKIMLGGGGVRGSGGGRWALVIMAAKANENGSNVRWSFKVILESCWSLVFRCFLVDISMWGMGGGGGWGGGVGCFDKVVGHCVSSCI